MDPLLLLFILGITSSTCKGADACSVWPKDQHIEFGSSTVVFCDTSCVNGEIFWTINGSRVDKSAAQTVNSTHAVLSLRNFSQRRAVVECGSVSTQQSVGGTVITAYAKPRNISCILHYDNERGLGVPQLLTCTWEHLLYSSVEVNYTLLFVSSLSKTIEICKPKVPTCTVKGFYDSKEIGLYVGDNFTLKVRAKTHVWESYSDSYEFNLYHILKIKPPKFAAAAFSDHLLVEFNRSDAAKKLHCQVRYSKVSSTHEQTTEWVFDRTVRKVKMYIMEQLESCRSYRLWVRCGLPEAPWSDWSREKTLLTKLNRSRISLRLWRKVTEVQSDGVRKVRAMWQDIPSTCEGTFTYGIKQTPGKHEYILCRSSACDVSVNRDAHRINVTVFDNDEPLAEESVYVPAVAASVPRVTDIQTSALDGVILVSWRPPVQPVRGYVIDWTNNGNRYHWEESKGTNATLRDLLDEEPYDITVTPLFDDKTGHGTRVLQICSRVGEPGIVSISNVQPYDKSAEVSWVTKSLGSCSGAPISYSVFYWTQKGPLLNVTADNKREKVFLKDLDPDTQYRVYVEATALTGTTVSQTMLFKTQRFNQNLVTLLIICGCLIIVLVLSFGLGCAVQWKKFSDQPVPNPGLSSLALWPSSNGQKGTCFYQPFSNPSEDTCDKVYTEESTNSSRPSHAASDRSEEYADSAFVQDEKPADPVETQHPSFARESAGLLSSGGCSVSPYRSQTSVETQMSKTGERCHCGLVKEQDEASMKTVYVTLDMYEHDQTR